MDHQMGHSLDKKLKKNCQGVLTSVKIENSFRL